MDFIEFHYLRSEEKKGTAPDKTGGSVENFDDDQNHDVVGEGHQAEVAALAVVGVAVDVRDHARPHQRDDEFFRLSGPRDARPAVVRR
jgi:hypothetical protein